MIQIKEMRRSLDNHLTGNASPFFIVGSQRSGTTLLRLILNAHSKLAIPEEGTFWMPILRFHSNHPDRAIPPQRLKRYFEYIRKNTQFRLWGLDPGPTIGLLLLKTGGVTFRQLMTAFYDAYVRQEGKLHWGEKSSVFFRKIDAINKIFPDAKFIHIIRDGRDVFLSWRKLIPSRTNICIAALEWKFKVKKIEKAFRELPNSRHITLRYEDLVSNPEETVNKVCAFLKVEFEQRMTEFWRESKHYIGSHHSDLIFQPISTGAMGKWAKSLDEFEQVAYERLAGDVLRQYNYACNYPNHRLEYRELLQLGLLTLIGLSARGYQVFLTAVRLWIAAKLGIKTTAAGKGETPVSRA